MFRAVYVIKRYPFTITLILVSWALGIIDQTYRGPLPHKWLTVVGVNAHNLEHGRIYTLITPVVFSSSAPMFWGIALYIVISVGAYEHLVGTKQALFLYWTVNTLALLMVIYLIGKPLQALHVGLGKEILKNPEVGPSAGGYGVIAGTIALLPTRYRRSLLAALAAFLFVIKPLIHFEPHGDTAHIVSFVLGYAIAEVQIHRKAIFPIQERMTLKDGAIQVKQGQAG